jgi:hypothetical protein
LDWSGLTCSKRTENSAKVTEVRGKLGDVMECRGSNQTRRKTIL